MSVITGAEGIHVASISAAAILFDNEERVLLIHENYDRRRWSLPGGAVETDEAPWETAVRETREEIGVDIEVVRLAAVCHVVTGDARPHHLAFGFVARIVSGEPHVALPEEIAQIAWTAPSLWPEPRTRSGPALVNLAAAGATGAYCEA